MKRLLETTSPTYLRRLVREINARLRDKHTVTAAADGVIGRAYKVASVSHSGGCVLGHTSGGFCSLRADSFRDETCAEDIAASRES